MVQISGEWLIQGLYDTSVAKISGSETTLPHFFLVTSLVEYSFYNLFVLKEITFYQWLVLLDK